MIGKRVKIETLPTGVLGLDEILGGGIPKLSFNVILGAPGTGKTTLALQIAFNNATPERPALCFTVLGEPTVKLLRHQQQFTFFDPERVGVDVHVLNLAEEIIQGNGDMGPVLDRIQREVAAIKPGFVVIDSCRSLARFAAPSFPTPPAVGMERFMQLLAHQLTIWQVTAFLIGEYEAADLANPLFTVADGIVCLSHKVERSSSLRWLQCVKQRGVAPMAGVHTMRITDAGIEVFPRIIARRREATVASAVRVSTGIPDLDAMMGGGIVAGDSVVVTGPSGAGKSAFSMEFLNAAGTRKQSAVVVVFEEEPNAFLARTITLGRDLTPMRDAGRLEIMSLAPLDLSVDETMHELREAIKRIDAKCVVIDSLSGFELALAPSFREDFRESIYRVVRAITATGVTVVMTVEVVEAGVEVRSPTRQLSFLADDILQIRYLEIQGEMRSVLNVVKMRKSGHSHLLREYEVTPTGVRLGRTLREYDSILIRSPERRIGLVQGSYAGPHAGLSEREVEVLQRLIRGNQMSVKDLADALALPVEPVTAALDRMVALGFAEALGAGKAPLFRALAQPVVK